MAGLRRDYFFISPRHMIALGPADLNKHRLQSLRISRAVTDLRRPYPNRQRFGLSARQWEAFQAALSAPPRPAPRMARLLKRPSVFDRGDI